MGLSGRRDNRGGGCLGGALTDPAPGVHTPADHININTKY